MKIKLILFWNIKIKDRFYIINIDASCHNISCHKYVEFTGSVKIHYPVPLSLTAVTVKDFCRDSGCGQLLPDLGSLDLCVAEDYRFSQIFFCHYHDYRLQLILFGTLNDVFIYVRMVFGLGHDIDLSTS